jgi:hypothetical protein
MALAAQPRCRSPQKNKELEGPQHRAPSLLPGSHRGARIVPRSAQSVPLDRRFTTIGTSQSSHLHNPPRATAPLRRRGVGSGRRTAGPGRRPHSPFSEATAAETRNQRQCGGLTMRGRGQPSPRRGAIDEQIHTAFRSHGVDLAADPDLGGRPESRWYPLGSVATTMSADSGTLSLYKYD